MDDDAAGTRQAVDQTRIMLRPVGSPLPLGFFAFGTGMLLVGGLELGWVAQRDATTIWLLLLAFVAPLEFTASLWAFLSRDTLGATGLALFAGSWAATGVVGLQGPPAQEAGLALFFAAFAVAVAVLGAIALAGKPLLAVILFLASARAAVLAAAGLSGAAVLLTTAGWLAVVIAVVAAYGSAALLLEDTRKRTILPIFRRGASEVSMRGSFDEQLEELPSEAGVRRQL